MTASTRPPKKPARPKSQRPRPEKTFGETKLSPDEPTPAQRLLLRGMARLAQQLDHTPTTYEIAEELGYADHTGVIKPLRQLVRRGLVDYTPRLFVPAAFRLTPAGRRWL